MAVAEFRLADLSTETPSGLAALIRRRLAAFKSDQGSELLETALTLPIYLAVIFGLTSLAIVVFAYGNATFAGKAAVRYAVVHSAATMQPCSASDIQNIINPFLWGVPTGGATIISSWNPSNTLGSIVTVTVTISYNTGLPYIGLSGLNATATANGYIVH